jgi:hypothetical protein
MQEQIRLLRSLANAAFPERFLGKRLAKQFNWVFGKMRVKDKVCYRLKIVHLLRQRHGFLEQCTGGI